MTKDRGGSHRENITPIPGSWILQVLEGWPIFRKENRGTKIGWLIFHLPWGSEAVRKPQNVQKNIFEKKFE